MLKNRIVDFESVAGKIEQARGVEDLCCFDIDLNAMAKRAGVRDCFVCGFPLHNCGALARDAIAVCCRCLHLYVTAGDYVESLARFKASVENANRCAQALAARVNSGQAIDEKTLGALVTGLQLSEVEFYLGPPKDLGSFDHGLELGKWVVAGVAFDLWFQSQVCVSVRWI